MDPYIAQVLFWGLNFSPIGWMPCDGRLLAISDYTALFALIGTTYGGDGVTTFGLPDLRGRVPVGQGTGPGLTSRTLGEMAGVESVTVLTTQMPAHTHPLTASSATPTTASPASASLPTGSSRIYATGSASIAMATGGVGPGGGGSQPHSNLQPYLALNPVICVEGIFPSRS